jgi:hypothetical protein
VDGSVPEVQASQEKPFNLESSVSNQLALPPTCVQRSVDGSVLEVHARQGKPFNLKPSAPASVGRPLFNHWPPFWREWIPHTSYLNLKPSVGTWLVLPPTGQTAREVRAKVANQLLVGLHSSYLNATLNTHSHIHPESYEECLKMQQKLQNNFATGIEDGLVVLALGVAALPKDDSIDSMASDSTAVSMFEKDSNNLELKSELDYDGHKKWFKVEVQSKTPMTRRVAPTVSNDVTCCDVSLIGMLWKFIMRDELAKQAARVETLPKQISAIEAIINAAFLKTERETSDVLADYWA